MERLRRLLAAFRLRAGEAAVAGRDTSESPLGRAKLRPRAVLDPLDLQLAMRVAERTVTANTLGHLHGGATERRYRGELVFMGSWVCSENFLEPADRGLDPRTRNPAAQYSGPRETWTLESQQIYIAKLINGGEIQ